MDEVSRQAAIIQLSHNKTGDDDHDVIVQKDIETIMQSAKPRIGKWIRDGHHIKCDQCGICMCDTDREGDKIPNNFCPNCGMKMEKEQDG